MGQIQSAISGGATAIAGAFKVSKIAKTQGEIAKTQEKQFKLAKETAEYEDALSRIHPTAEEIYMYGGTRSAKEALYQFQHDTKPAELQEEENERAEAERIQQAQFEAADIAKDKAITTKATTRTRVRKRAAALAHKKASRKDFGGKK